MLLGAFIAALSCSTQKPALGVLPRAFGGTKVQPLYQWAPYGSWPYAEMYVTP